MACGSKLRGVINGSKIILGTGSDVTKCEVRRPFNDSCSIVPGHLYHSAAAALTTTELSEPRNCCENDSSRDVSCCVCLRLDTVGTHATHESQSSTAGAAADALLRSTELRVQRYRRQSLSVL